MANTSVWIATAKLVDGLLYVAHEDGAVGQCGEFQEQGQLHGVGVLELVHQQQLYFVAQPFAHLLLIQRVQRELLHVGEVD